MRNMATSSDGGPGFTRYFRWKKDNQTVLPVSSTGSGGSDTSLLRSSVLSSWPPWSNSATTPWFENLGLSTSQRYMAFGLLILGALLLFFLSFVHMPLLIVRPGKFIIPFCLANFFIFCSFGFIYGFYSYIKHLFSSNRWPFTAAFLGTTMLTLYVAMVMRMYALTFPAVVLQLISTIAYVISYIPGGAGNVKSLVSFAFSSFGSRIFS